MNTNEIIIEKGIPLPMEKGQGNRYGRWVSLIRQMEIGDSILVPASAFSSIYMTCKRNGWKIRTRKQLLQPEDKFVKLRMWLVGKETP